MNLGELRKLIGSVTDPESGQLVHLGEDAEVVVEGDGCWLRAEDVAATFLRGRWTFLIRTARRGDPMWADEPSAGTAP